MVVPTILPLWEDKIDWEMKKGLFCQIVGFPDIIGKICLQSTDFDAGNNNHPAQIEAKIMKTICTVKGQKTKTRTKYQRFLPQIVFEKTIPVWSRHLVNLPMRRFAKDIHTHCNMILTPRYHCNLAALRTDKNETITLDEYRYIIFGVLYSLLMLQKHHGFVHSDLHAENILLRHQSEESRKDMEFSYVDAVSKQKTTWRIPAAVQRYTPILWDFENARLFNDDELNHNPMSENQADVPFSFCDRYDAHYFLADLVEFIPENPDAMPEVIRKWVHSMYAEEILPNSSKYYHDTILDHEDNLLQETKHHVKALLDNEMFPENLKLKLEDYCISQWGSGESDENDSDQDSTNFDHSPEDFYDENDGYYDYLMSQYPKDGVMWPTRIHQLNVQSKTDLHHSSQAAIIGNRLSNSYQHRNDIPTPYVLLTSNLFQEFLCVNRN